MGYCSPRAGKELQSNNHGICFISGAAGVLVGHPFDTVKVG